jgi:ABC-type polysaccharide/polyol phosphate export permease
MKSLLNAVEPLANIKDIWRYRELFYFLAWRDIPVRYKQIVEVP